MDLERPFDFLEACVGEEVKVQRNNGTTVRGTLEAWDKHMNLVLGSKNGVSLVRGQNILDINLNDHQTVFDL